MDLPLSGPPSLPSNATIDWYSFLGRPRLTALPENSSEQLQQQVILITGAAGSIGSALALRLASFAPSELVLLDSSEQGLYRLQSLLASNSTQQTRLVLGDAGDPPLLDELCTRHRITLIVHAAAYKHLNLLESQPLASLSNNVLTTLRVLECAARHNIPRTVLLSTDKVVTPTSILGAGKAIAERLTTEHGGVSVRLANVLGTEGSVVETFLDQLRNHRPLSVRGSQSTRFFLTPEEAVDILIAAALDAIPGTTLIPNLPRPQSILELAHFLSRHLNLTPQITLTELAPGEKSAELLCSPEEDPIPSTISGCLQLRPPSTPPLLPSLPHLESAIIARDLNRTLDLVQQFIPAYRPSATLLQQLEVTR